MTNGTSATRLILRTVLIVVLVVLALYMIYLLRKPLSWLIIAAFIAIAAAGPVTFLSRYMKRGLAIMLVYLSILLIPIGLGILLAPPVVHQVGDLAGNAPSYARDVEDYVNQNQTLQNLDDKYDLTTKLNQEAAKLPNKTGDAAKVFADIGVGAVNRIFAAVTIFILSIFMVAAGPRWAHRFIQMQRPEHAERIERTLQRIANAVGNYVGGAAIQATIAGLTSFLVLTLLGVPFAGPLAVVVFFFDLIPVVGTTIAALLVAIVAAFVNPPVALIVWVTFAIVYAQVENYLIQPQIQKRATEIEPFIVLVAVLFGSTLFGIVGALLAIPTAASIQIAVREWSAYRAESAEQEKLKRKPQARGGAKPRARSKPKPNPA
ncbi:MAG: AI-2E family transporter [Solirubrobacterales bacterium]|nr:AI-2E family transporter [Solirubrobacterales bacterium]